MNKSVDTNKFEFFWKS